jgi:hypothetical protein
MVVTGYWVVSPGDWYGMPIKEGLFTPIPLVSTVGAAGVSEMALEANRSFVQIRFRLDLMI